MQMRRGKTGWPKDSPGVTGSQSAYPRVPRGGARWRALHLLGHLTRSADTGSWDEASTYASWTGTNAVEVARPPPPHASQWIPKERDPSTGGDTGLNGRGNGLCELDFNIVNENGAREVKTKRPGDEAAPEQAAAWLQLMLIVVVQRSKGEGETGAKW
ncbi:hypothetical protein F5888DRAFT_1639127 [Russula emetica]|nr:hypothetical protein F5888DRAFT_1639127 [Russula emetica]